MSGVTWNKNLLDSTLLPNTIVYELTIFSQYGMRSANQMQKEI